jgi:hypothetical protein
MTTDESREDDVLRALRGIAARDMDGGRAALIREHCHRILSRRAGRGRAWSSPRRHRTRRVLEPLVVSCACAVYLWEVVRRALWLSGM